jgi:2,3-bisphosphoglycerate-dependent phosphoglycerate mutase
MNLILIITLFFLTQSPSTTTYYLVRHAEKACEDCNSCGLSQSGNVRAAALASYLSNKNIDMIFASQCLRTSSTAQPLADKLGKDVSIYNTEQLNTLISTLTSINNKNILIIGHSNQIPIIVKALSRKRVYISDTDFDNIYVITKTGLAKSGSLKKLTYGAKTK